MPNTPSLIRAGITGLYARQSVTEAQKKQAESIMQAGGSVVWVEKEEHIDIVAALSGSGPAYFFKVMEALQAGAEKLGLPSEQAKMLTLQTALGAAKMAATSTHALKALREQVTSKGGMTARAIQVLETGGIEQLFYEALFAGQQRAHEMAEELKNQ
jgi:pyrroline-5-carboxylate reductase